MVGDKGQRFFQGRDRKAGTGGNRSQRHRGQRLAEFLQTGGPRVQVGRILPVLLQDPGHQTLNQQPLLGRGHGQGDPGQRIEFAGFIFQDHQGGPLLDGLTDLDADDRVAFQEVGADDQNAGAIPQVRRRVGRSGVPQADLP